MSLRVLVADDSSTMRQIIVRSLQSIAPANITEAADGDEALALFKPGAFDLVLTDWHMPGKCGLDVVREIRLLDRKAPVIMITTEADRSSVVQAIAAGVSDYLVKPFTIESLRDKLRRQGC